MPQPPATKIKSGLLVWSNAAVDVCGVDPSGIADALTLARARKAAAPAAIDNGFNMILSFRVGDGPHRCS
jgi:hypothetical protein